MTFPLENSPLENAYHKYSHALSEIHISLPSHAWTRSRGHRAASPQGGHAERDKHIQVSVFDQVQALLSSPCELGLSDMVGLLLGGTHLSKLKDSKM